MPAKLLIMTVVLSLFSTNLVSAFAGNTVASYDGFYPDDEEIVQTDEEAAQAGSILTMKDGFIDKPFVSDNGEKRYSLDYIAEYIVEPTDTISDIATYFGISQSTLILNNNLKKDAALKVGQKLVILPVSGYLYVADNDKTVEELAKQFQVSDEQIKSVNKRGSNKQIAKGEKIIIPGVEVDMLKAKASGTPMIAAAVSDVSKLNVPRIEKVKEIKKAITGKNDPKASKNAKNTKTNAPDKQPKSTVASRGGFIWPTSSPSVSQGYGRGHPALDIVYMKGGERTTGIMASASGTVHTTTSGWAGGYGNSVVIDHGNGYYTRYAHMSKIYVSRGQRVSQGEVIGWMGNTGRVYGRTGLHLHFEVMVGGVYKRISPYSVL